MISFLGLYNAGQSSWASINEAPAAIRSDQISSSRVRRCGCASSAARSRRSSTRPNRMSATASSDGAGAVSAGDACGGNGGAGPRRTRGCASDRRRSARRDRGLPRRRLTSATRDAGDSAAPLPKGSDVPSAAACPRSWSRAPPAPPRRPSGARTAAGVARQPRRRARAGSPAARRARRRCSTTRSSRTIRARSAAAARCVPDGGRADARSLAAGHRALPAGRHLPGARRRSATGGPIPITRTSSRAIGRSIPRRRRSTCRSRATTGSCRSRASRTRSSSRARSRRRSACRPPRGPAASTCSARARASCSRRPSSASADALQGLDRVHAARDRVPPDTLAYNQNYVDVNEKRILDVRPTAPTHPLFGRLLGVQEAFVDYHIRNTSDRYDFDSVRVGIQPFQADFRGFLFNDNQLGVRLFGNRDDNRFQYNLAGFWRLEKDTNSGLNDRHAAPASRLPAVRQRLSPGFPGAGLHQPAALRARVQPREEPDPSRQERLSRSRPALLGDDARAQLRRQLSRL